MNISISKTRFQKIGPLILLLITGIAGWVVFNRGESIVTYDDSRAQTEFILGIFKKDWDWLIPPGSDFSPEHMLKYKTKSTEIKNLNSITIKVAEYQSKPVGFIVYYKETFYQGFINFLAVDDKYRRQGFARKLMLYAIDDLRKQGCTVIRLLTRVVNTKAQKLYESLGFKEYERDDYAVYYKFYLS